MIAEDADPTPDPYLDPGRIIMSVKKQFLKNIARFLFMRNSDPEADHTPEVVHDLARDKTTKKVETEILTRDY